MNIFKLRNLVFAVGIAFFAAVMVFGNHEDEGQTASLAEVSAAAGEAAPQEELAQAASTDGAAPLPDAWYESEDLADAGPIASSLEQQGKAGRPVRTQTAAQAGVGSSAHARGMAQQSMPPGGNVRGKSEPLNENSQRDSMAALAEDVRDAIDP